MQVIYKQRDIFTSTPVAQRIKKIPDKDSKRYYEEQVKEPQMKWDDTDKNECKIGDIYFRQCLSQKRTIL